MEMLPLLAGLGLFMLGMKQLEESIAALAGVTFRRFVRDHASTPLRGIVVGTGATAVLQSSSLVPAGAGLRRRRHPAAGRRDRRDLGANLGTTVTGWLVATLGFKLDLSTPGAAMGVGGGRVLLPRGAACASPALVVGIGLLLFGLDLMKQGVESFAGSSTSAPSPTCRCGRWPCSAWASPR
jgi:phosphate:Na+ symporter